MVVPCKQAPGEDGNQKEHECETKEFGDWSDRDGQILFFHARREPAWRLKWWRPDEKSEPEEFFPQPFGLTSHRKSIFINWSQKIIERTVLMGSLICKIVTTNH